MSKTLCYEHPLNETTRACLRIEFLIQQFEASKLESEVFPGLSRLWALSNILTIFDRPDIKNKWLQELKRLETLFERWRHTEEADASSVWQHLNDIQSHVRKMHDTPGKLASELRKLEFLNQARQHLSQAGSCCSADSPLIHFWLAQPKEKQNDQLETWWHQLKPWNQMILLLLKIYRKSMVLFSGQTTEGFFQTSMDPLQSCPMIRIFLPEHLACYPEVSAGKHHLFVRFFAPSVSERPTPFSQNLCFDWGKCLI